MFEDVAGVTDRGRAITARASPEGHSAMDLTLQMLDDQLKRLEKKLTDTDKHLMVGTIHNLTLLPTCLFNSWSSSFHQTLTSSGNYIEK